MPPTFSPIHPSMGGDKPGTPGWGREGSLTLGRALLLQPSGCSRLTPPHSPCRPSQPPGWAGPGAPLSALGLGFPRSWEPSVGFCWQTERSFHVERLVQCASS